MPPKPKSHALSLTVFLALLLAGLWQWQNLADFWALNIYRPSQVAVNFADQGKFSDKARAIFYLARPQLDDKAQFNQDCQIQHGELELGCYRNWRIYILKINHTELKPVELETAAHEMLHAAYVRLGSSEKTRIDKLLEKQAGLLNDAELNQLLARYEQTEPGQRLNELHSLIGTQFANLLPELETYYGRYFKDRRAVVAAHQAYERAFASRKADLDGRLADINAEKAGLNSLNAQMNAYLRSGNISAYNSLVPRQNFLVADLRDKINAYNQLVQEYNALSASLDSEELTPADLEQ